MNTTRQALHILVKDLRGFWSEIGSIVLLNAVLAWTSIVFANEAATNGPVRLMAPPTSFRAVVVPLLIVTWCLFIVRLVHADGPASARQLWLTRPVSRTSLLLAKLLGIAIVVHGLTATTQIVILMASGVPWSLGQIVVNQLFLMCLLSLPVALVAALTARMRSFVPAAIGLAVATALVVAGLSVPFGADDLQMAEDFPSTATTFQFYWLRTATCVALLGAIAAGAFVRQYRRRQPLRVLRGAAVGWALLALLYAVFPESLGSFVEARLLGQREPVPTVSFRPDGLGNVVRPYAYRGPFPIDLPLAIRGQGPDDFAFFAEHVDIRTRSGIERSFTANVWGSRATAALQTADERVYWLRINVPRLVYEQLAFEPVQVSIRFDVRRYGRDSGRAIPVGGDYATVAERTQCRVEFTLSLFCREAFAVPAVTLYGGFANAPDVEATLTRDTVRLPLGIVPFSSRRITSAQLDGVDTSLPLTVRAPTAYYHVQLDLDEVRIADFNRMSPEERRL